MKVLFASASGTPFKTGGLGDGLCLAKKLAKQGVDIRVVLPYYTQTPQYKDRQEIACSFRFQLGDGMVYCGIKYLEMDGGQYYSIDNGYLAMHPSMANGMMANASYFSTAGQLRCWKSLGWIPDIIHCNDYNFYRFMVPVLLVDHYHWKDRLRHLSARS